MLMRLWRRISPKINMFYVYVLWSVKLRKRYVGSAKNPNERLGEHNTGKSRFTKGGIPWMLIHTEKYDSISSARKREIFLKSGIGRKWLDENLSNKKRFFGIAEGSRRG